MESLKCRNSVFCVRFLFFFLVGTICGIWLYRCFCTTDYGRMIRSCILPQYSGAGETWAVFCAWFRPIVLAWLLIWSSFGSYMLPFLVGGRGLLTSYTACALLHAGLSPGSYLIQGILILPLFYRLCFLADYR